MIEILFTSCFVKFKKSLRAKLTDLDKTFHDLGQKSQRNAATKNFGPTRNFPIKNPGLKQQKEASEINSEASSSIALH